MKAKLTVTSVPSRTPRVLQVASMYDMPLEKKLTRSWDVTLPIDDSAWNVGLIVGESGSGKTSVARHLWPGQFRVPEWTGAALVDEFPQHLSIKDIMKSLTSVGLNSTATWLSPFTVLSNGEKFRAEMARLLAEAAHDEVVVVDEFSSVVDRTVAQVASHCLQKAIRRAGARFVAVSCHWDIEEWLQPDWLLTMPEGTFQWRQKKSHPPIQLEIREVSRRYWSPAYDHLHYLSASLPNAAECYGSFIDGEMVCFTACTRRVHPSPKAKLIWQASRQVVLPSWQGLGIGWRTEDWLAERYCSQGFRFRSLTSHPAAIAYYQRSPHWRLVHRGEAHQLKSGGRANSGFRKHQAELRMLGVQCWEYTKRPAGRAAAAT